MGGQLWVGVEPTTGPEHARQGSGGDKVNTTQVGQRGESASGPGDTSGQPVLPCPDSTTLQRKDNGGRATWACSE